MTITDDMTEHAMKAWKAVALGREPWAPEDAMRAALTAALAAQPVEPVALSDERIDAIADIVIKGMPDGARGWLSSWGYRQFARALLDDCRGHFRAEPQRVPLTQRQIDDAYIASDAEGWPDNFTAGARFAERAHGITLADTGETE